VRDASDGHQLRPQDGAPWDPWTRAPAPDRLPPPEFQPPAQPRPSPQFRPPPESQPWSRPPAGFQPPDGSGPPGARPAQHKPPPARRRERSRWYLLLPVAVVIPLLTALYNRTSPELLGLPFFYWCQMAFVVMAASVTAIVQLATRKRP